jgi:hypothetical protein
VGERSAQDDRTGRRAAGATILLILLCIGLLVGVSPNLVAMSDVARYRRPPSLNTGILPPNPDGSEPAAELVLIGSLRYRGPFERVTIKRFGFVNSGSGRVLTPAEADAIAAEWADSTQSRGHRWLRNAIQHPSPGARVTWRAVSAMVWGLVALITLFVGAVLGLRRRAWMRRHERALYNTRRGLCPSCGYPLASTGGQRCPECGIDPPTMVAEARRAVKTWPRL